MHRIQSIWRDFIIQDDVFNLLTTTEPFYEYFRKIEEAKIIAEELR